MKKLMIIAIVLLFFATYSWGGSSRVALNDNSSSPDVRITILASGDSIADLTLGKNVYDLNGLYLYGIVTIPSTPDAVYDVSVSSGAFVMCDATSRSTTLTEGYSCDAETNKFEKVYTDLTVAIDNLGAGSTTIYIDFISIK